MPTFTDNSDFLAELQQETLNLPIRGKVFRFAGSPSLLVGAKLREMQRKLLLHAQGKLPADTVVLPDPAGTYIEMAGDQYAALQAHGVTDAEFDLIGQTLLNFYLYGADVAEKTWTGELQRQIAEAQGEAQPTGTTKTATPKANRKPSPGGTPTTRSSRSSKATSPATTASS